MRVLPCALRSRGVRRMAAADEVGRAGHGPGQPWPGDACSLVDAFRSGDRSPREELEATYAAIGRSDLNAFSFLDPERALAAAEHADLSKPFGGVPVGIKELDQVEGWPDTGASLIFKDPVATSPSGPWGPARRGRAVPSASPPASEFAAST